LPPPPPPPAAATGAPSPKCQPAGELRGRTPSAAADAASRARLDAVRRLSRAGRAFFVRLREESAEAVTPPDLAPKSPCVLLGGRPRGARRGSEQQGGAGPRAPARVVDLLPARGGGAGGPDALGDARAPDRPSRGGPAPGRGQPRARRPSQPRGAASSVGGRRSHAARGRRAGLTVVEATLSVCNQPPIKRDDAREAVAAWPLSLCRSRRPSPPMTRPVGTRPERFDRTRVIPAPVGLCPPT
jgi:hypothetical protein